MKFLQSSWAAAIVGLLGYWLTTYVCWTKASATLTPPPVAHPTIELAKTNGPSWEYKNPEVGQLIDDLRKQKEALALREQQLKEFEARLQTERIELNQITQRVGLMQSEFDRLVVEVKKEEVPNLKKLAKNYSSMSPDGAANILKELTDAQLVKILTLMKEAESGPILEALGKGSDADSKRAALLTERMRLTLSKNATAKPKAP
jgi:flagellar motility protein MotE (MotC chaperone)